MQQGELFPFLSLDTLRAHCRRLYAKCLGVAPDLAPADVMRLRGELALVHLVLERLLRLDTDHPSDVDAPARPECLLADCRSLEAIVVRWGPVLSRGVLHRILEHVAQATAVVEQLEQRRYWDPIAAIRAALPVVRIPDPPSFSRPPAWRRRSGARTGG
ncbi:MAG TPA: hypothetical protein VNX15_02500 [Gemmatimonadales bacterium]|nr:hypothetical protein [Gemmatimonadales bacterium]